MAANELFIHSRVWEVEGHAERSSWTTIKQTAACGGRWREQPLHYRRASPAWTTRRKNKRPWRQQLTELENIRKHLAAEESGTFSGGGGEQTRATREKNAASAGRSARSVSAGQPELTEQLLNVSSRCDGLPPPGHTRWDHFIITSSLIFSKGRHAYLYL